MKQQKAVLLIFALCLSMIACSDDKNEQPTFPTFDGGVNNTNNDNNTNNTNNVEPDMDAVDMAADMEPTNNGMPDVGVDLNVMTPGFLHGTWNVIVETGDPAIEGQFATFTFRHEEGATSATGIYKIQEGQGELGRTDYENDQLTTSFSARINNISETFGITMASPVDQDTIEGDYSWSGNGTFGDVRLERVE